MNMKILLVVFVVFGLSGFAGATEAQMRDGKIVFQKYTVSHGNKAFTDKEKDEYVARYKKVKATDTVNAEVTDIVPEPWETALSTCAIWGTNYSDFKAAQDKKKSAVLKKAIEVKKKRDDYSDFPESAEYIDYKQRYDWLKSFYESLP